MVVGGQKDDGRIGSFIWGPSPNSKLGLLAHQRASQQVIHVQMFRIFSLFRVRRLWKKLDESSHVTR